MKNELLAIPFSKEKILYKTPDTYLFIEENQFKKSEKTLEDEPLKEEVKKEKTLYENEKYYLTNVRIISFKEEGFEIEEYVIIQLKETF